MDKDKAAYLKRKDRERKRKLGYVLKQIWVKPGDWENIQLFIKKMNKG